MITEVEDAALDRCDGDHKLSDLTGRARLCRHHKPPFLANEDVTGHPCFGFLQTIRIDDPPSGGQWSSKPRLRATTSTVTFLVHGSVEDGQHRTDHLRPLAA
jgi:hypothetical protein